MKRLYQVAEFRSAGLWDRSLEDLDDPAEYVRRRLETAAPRFTEITIPPNVSVLTPGRIYGAIAGKLADGTADTSAFLVEDYFGYYGGLR